MIPERRMLHAQRWVVDPEHDAIRVYRGNGGRFGRPVQLSAEAGDVLTTPHLEGLQIPLARVLRT